MENSRIDIVEQRVTELMQWTQEINRKQDELKATIEEKFRQRKVQQENFRQLLMDNLKLQFEGTRATFQPAEIASQEMNQAMNQGKKQKLIAGNLRLLKEEYKEVDVDDSVQEDRSVSEMITATEEALKADEQQVFDKMSDPQCNTKGPIKVVKWIDKTLIKKLTSEESADAWFPKLQTEKLIGEKMTGEVVTKSSTLERSANPCEQSVLERHIMKYVTELRQRKGDMRKRVDALRKIQRRLSKLELDPGEAALTAGAMGSEADEEDDASVEKDSTTGEQKVFDKMPDPELRNEEPIKLSKRMMEVNNKDEDKQSGSQGYPTPTVKNLKRKCLDGVVESGTMPPKAPLILQQSVEGATATAIGVDKITSNVNEEKTIIFDPGGAVLGDDGYGKTDIQEFQITKVARMGDKHLLPVKNRQDKVEEHCLATKEGCESPFESLVQVISNLEWSRGCYMVIDIDTRRQLGPTTSVSSNKSIQFRTLGKVVALQGIGQEVSANIFVLATNLLDYWAILGRAARVCLQVLDDHYGPAAFLCNLVKRADEVSNKQRMMEENANRCVKLSWSLTANVTGKHPPRSPSCHDSTQRRYSIQWLAILWLEDKPFLKRGNVT